MVLTRVVATALRPEAFLTCVWYLVCVCIFLSINSILRAKWKGRVAWVL